MEQSREEKGGGPGCVGARAVGARLKASEPGQMARAHRIRLPEDAHSEPARPGRQHNHAETSEILLP